MNIIKLTPITLCFIFAVVISGCSTIVAHSEKETPLPYAGTKTAIKKVKKSWQRYEYYGQIYIYLIDTPFSFMADTLLYPLDSYRFDRAKPMQ